MPAFVTLHFVDAQMLRDAALSDGDGPGRLDAWAAQQADGGQLLRIALSRLLREHARHEAPGAKEAQSPAQGKEAEGGKTPQGQEAEKAAAPAAPAASPAPVAESATEATESADKKNEAPAKDAAGDENPEGAAETAAADDPSVRLDQDMHPIEDEKEEEDTDEGVRAEENGSEQEGDDTSLPFSSDEGYEMDARDISVHGEFDEDSQARGGF